MSSASPFARRRGAPPRVAVVVALAMLAAASGSAGPACSRGFPAVTLAARVQNSDQEFLARLAAAGIRVDAPTDFVNDGHAVCKVLDIHSSRGELVIAAMAMKNKHNLTEDQAKTLVTEAVRAYCPNHADALG